MTTRAGEIIRGWLGWCPNGQGARLQGRVNTADGHHNAFPDVQKTGTPDPGVPGASGSPLYEHTQTGYLLLGAIGAVCLFLFGMMLLLGPELVLALVLCIMIAVLSIMSSLTVSIREEKLAIRFGPVRLIRKDWAVSDVVSVIPVANPWYYGYGIHWTPRGPLYNVSGNKAVEILLLSGKTFRIGTDEPEALCRALGQACGMQTEKTVR